jgi:glycosyltransferase involved in cell wall biosynthesis
MTPPRGVVHVVDASAEAGPGLWGKERLVQALMRAQRAGGALDPALALFAAHPLGEAMQEEGFAVTVLGRRGPGYGLETLPALRRTLSGARYVHAHGYKANVLTRLLRLCGGCPQPLVATCHGWVDGTAMLRLYNALDRRSAFVSDAVTVPDPAMIARFSARARTVCVPNGLPDAPLATPQQRAAVRERWGFEGDRPLVLCVGRVTEAKGALDVLEAARRTPSALWAWAGTGDCAERLAREGPPNLWLLGYVPDAAALLPAADLYVQASHFEGLSLALLEAMRAGKAIVATAVGATPAALRDGIEGRIVAACDAPALASAVANVLAEPERASAYGAAGRARFLADFTIERQAADFLALYRSCEREP